MMFKCQTRRSQEARVWPDKVIRAGCRLADARGRKLQAVEFTSQLRH